MLHPAFFFDSKKIGVPQDPGTKKQRNLGHPASVEIGNKKTPCKRINSNRSNFALAKLLLSSLPLCCVAERNRICGVPSEKPRTTLSFCSCRRWRFRELRAKDGPFADVQPDCGPTDGPALTFHFTSKQVHSGEYEEPFVKVSIYESLPRSAPTDYAIGARRDYVWASRCTSPAKCADAIAGSSLRINTVSAKGVSGVYELHFQDGTVKIEAPSTYLGSPQSHHFSAVESPLCARLRTEGRLPGQALRVGKIWKEVRSSEWQLNRAESAGHVYFFEGDRHQDPKKNCISIASPGIQNALRRYGLPGIARQE